MHPAVSVIFFTTLSGAGFGLMALLGLGLTADARGQAMLAGGLAFSLAVVGLLASTLHLGRPERAWRAFSQWRSSWLSREGVLAVVTLLLFAAYLWLWLVRGQRLPALGLVVSVLCGLTVFATAMIYAQLRTIPHWHTALTPACYLLFAAACGVLLATALGSSDAGHRPAWYATSVVAIGVSWLAKMAWWARARRASLRSTGASVGSATGLGALGKVRLLERPHSGPNYLTREMVHRIGRKHARILRRIAFTLGLLAPVLAISLVWWARLPGALLGAAFVSLMIGLLAERWLFFAEAEHSVSLYYD